MKLIIKDRAAILLAFVIAVCGTACSKGKTVGHDKPTDTTTVKPVVNQYALLADSAQSATYTTFLSSDGNYFIQNNTGNTNFNYWPQAHVLDVLLDGYLRTKNPVYTTRMKALLNGVKIKNGGGYPNEFYDDMGWMANACIRIYNVNKDPDYLNVAQILYTEIKGGNNNTEGGGIAWQRSQLYYKNTPSTGNAIILAARFYELQNNAADLTLAKSLYTWLKATLVNKNGAVYDGINRNKDGKIDYWDFSYNYGLVIGSAVELYNCTKDTSYLNDAIRTANSLVSDGNLVANGVLKSEGQGDGGLFNGVGIRYLTALTQLADLDKTNRTRFATFLQSNAQALYAKGVGRPSFMFSPDWTVPPSGNTDLTTQLSGMIMVEAAAKLKTASLIQ